MTSSLLDYLYKDPVSKYTHSLRYLGLGLQHIFGGGGREIKINPEQVMSRDRLGPKPDLMPSHFQCLSLCL